MIFLAEVREKMFYLPEAATDAVFPIPWEEQAILLLFLILTLLLVSKSVVFLRRWWKRKHR